LSAALAEWRGSALDDLQDFGFAQVFATALVEDRALVQTTRAAAEIACGRSEAIIGELEALITDHRYREPLWIQLITAYYVSERQSDALAAYQRLKTTLAEDLGIDPGHTVRELHEKILRQEPLLAKQSAKATAFRANQTARGTSAVPVDCPGCVIAPVVAIHCEKPSPELGGSPTTTSSSTTSK
jgi:DNA-binding SARP family transcriptional activator